MKSEEQSLIESARSVLERAHVPYSNFPVGAAIMDESGRIFTGVNVENASYGLTICAERVAIFSAIAAGSKNFKAIAVTSQRLRPVTPCGACRQVLAEFCPPDMPVLLDAENGAPIQETVAGLLPMAFNGDSLRQSEA